MKKRILSMLLVLVMVITMLPTQAIAAEGDSYTVSFTATNGNNRARYVQIMITDEKGETVGYVQTNDRGTASYQLPAGTYTATISYTSGNYAYYAENKFTVTDQDEEVTLDITSQYSPAAAENIYNRTTYFDHVDIRVKGTYTTGTTVDLSTYNIRLANVRIVVTNPAAYSRYNFSAQFTNNNETYEWRSTGKRIYKGASVTLSCDIYNSETGAIMKSGFTYTFYDGTHNGIDYGNTEFVKAIAQCDAHQGLDFIINPMEIIEAVFYSVRYDWDVVDAAGNYVSELPAGLATLPAAVEDAYEAGDAHTIDTHHQEGYYVIDEANGKRYTFQGWDWWSLEADNNLKKNVIGSDSTTVTVNEDTVIYGVWTVTDLDLAESHITVTKKFVDSNGSPMTPPSGYHMLLVGPRGGSMELPLSQFTYDEAANTYSYQLPVYTEGAYTITEHSYAIDGYTTAASVTVSESADAAAAGHDHVTAGQGTAAADSAAFTLKLDYATRSACSHVGQVDFVNTYTKKTGNAIHNYPTLAVNKLDADDRTVLKGAIFALYSDAAFQNFVAEGVSNESGYLYFQNLQPGTYYLMEITAPEGYLAGYALYKVQVTLKDGYPKEVLSGGAWCQLYEYDMGVEFSLDDGKTWEDSQHFSVGTTLNRFRLEAFNEKVSGKLTVSKSFTGVDADHYPASISVTVTYPDGVTSKNVVLDADNEWTATLSGLELGTYILEEAQAYLDGYQLESVTYNGGASGEVTISVEDVPAEYDTSEPVAEVSVEINNTYKKQTGNKYAWPDLTILKLRDADNSPLANAEFTLYSDESLSTVVASGTTNALGQLTFQDLKVDVTNSPENTATYYLKETAAPDTYAESSTVYKIVLSLSDKTELDNPEGSVFYTVYFYDLTVTDLAGGPVSFASETNQLTVTNTKDEGSLTVRKTFGVSNAYMPTQVIATVTGPNGYSSEVTLSPENDWTVTLTGLALGEYTVTEKLTEVEGYILSQESVTEVKVTLSAEVKDNVDLSLGTANLINTYTREVINPASFQIRKVDSKTGDVIATGAEFTLYSNEACTAALQTENTGVDGIATFYGFAEEATYYLKETKAPEGYELSTTVWKVTVELDGGKPVVKVNSTTNVWETIFNWVIGNMEPDSNWADGILTVANVKKTGKLTVSKTVEDPMGYYAEAEYAFVLDFSDDSFDQTFTLKAGESKVIENIPWGTTYTLTEVTTGAAFTGNADDVGSGKIWAAETAVNVTNTYQYTEHNTPLTLLKVDAGNTAKVIANAGFTLYEDETCETPISEEVFSDENGVVEILIAESGTYYLKETTAPDGYHVNGNVYTVTAQEELVVKNAGTSDAVTEIQMHIRIEELAGVTENQIDYVYSVENVAIKEVVVSVQKAWDDGGYYGRPESVKAVLLRDGEVYETVELSEENSWKYTWEGLTDEYDWSVDETDVPKEYTKTLENEGDSWTVTNTRAPKPVEITVTKAWNHNGGKTLPESINVTLYKDGKAYETKTLSAQNQWTYTWTGLTDASQWSVDETEVPAGYTKEINVNGYAFTITNTRQIQKLNVSVTKVWAASEGVIHPESVEAVLYRDGEVFDTVKLSADNDWSYEWVDLTDAYTWSVDEKTVPEGYTKNVTSQGTDFTITNTKNFKNIDISVNKVWYGADVDHPDSVSVVLYRDGEVYDTVVLSAENSWKHTWSGLTDEFEWEVDEPSVPSGYNKMVRRNENSWTITNTHEDNPRTGDVSTLVQWGLLGIAGITGFCATAVGLFKPRKKNSRQDEE